MWEIHKFPCDFWLDVSSCDETLDILLRKMHTSIQTYENIILFIGFWIFRIIPLLCNGLLIMGCKQLVCHQLKSIMCMICRFQKKKSVCRFSKSVLLEHKWGFEGLGDMNEIRKGEQGDKAMNC